MSQPGPALKDFPPGEMSTGAGSWAGRRRPYTRRGVAESGMLAVEPRSEERWLARGTAIPDLDSCSCPFVVPPPSASVTVVAARPPQLGNPAPVIVIDGDRIDEMGAPTLADLLGYISPTAFSRPEGYRVRGAQYAELRGIGTETVLVLINGRRAAKERTLNVRVEELKDEPERARVAEREEKTDESRLGIAVRPLTREEKQRVDTTGSVVVEEVSSVAARAGVQPGDIILGINGKPVQSVQELRGAVRSSQHSVARC